MLKNIFRAIFQPNRNATTACPICDHESPWIDRLDINRSCEDQEKPVFPPSGEKTDYYYCVNCGFCFAPEICAWPQPMFKARIYNADYELIDPDYLEKRPKENAQSLNKWFSPSEIQHLDYGGGNGELSRLLRSKGWASTSFDPMSSPEKPPHGEKYNLISAFEVFEHHPSPKKMMEELDELLAPDGMIFFSTLISDHEDIRPGALNWWYAAPRNGHISLYSKQALELLGRQFNLRFHSFSSQTHCYSRGDAPWPKNTEPERN